MIDVNRERNPQSAQTLGRIAWIALLAAFSLPGCGQRTNPYEPIPSEPTTGSVVTGIARATGGDALPGATVTLEGMQNGVAAKVRERIAAIALRGSDRLMKSEGLQASDGSIRATVTDQSGRYSFDAVNAGDYLLTAELRNHLAGVARFHVASPNGVALAETTIVNVNLTPTGSFYGSATLENATDHKSTIVYVDGTSYLAATNAAGGYVVTGVPIGTWTLHATHPGYLDRSVNGTLVAAGDSVGLSPMTLPINSNIAPTATAFTPTNATEGLAVTFNGSASDADGSIIRYEWDFEDDGVFDYSSPTAIATSHVYFTSGRQRAKLRVTDDKGAIGLAATTFIIGKTIFVSGSTGSGANPGTPSQPVQTITQGLTKAVTDSAVALFVAAGVYNESPAFLNGVSAYGGYDASIWLTAPGTTSVNVGTTPATFNNVSIATTIQRFAFIASSSTSNSVAFICSSSSSALSISSCSFQSAAAGAGAAGTNGVGGAGGGNGSPGQNGNCDGPQGNGGGGGIGACGGGAGGTGGAPGINAGANGSRGLCFGGFGGLGGPGGDPGGTAYGGQVGANGTNGAPGSGSSATGQVVGVVWTPNASVAGAPGDDGTGGGGGGGGGGQGGGSVTPGGGNGGGGGGGSGSGGTGGGGGTGGYGSFALFLVNSSPSVSQCVFQSGSGGHGGTGGNGGSGGVGGAGGAGATACPAQIGAGGNGGAGGAGGAGGGGAGGAGGPSYCIYRAGTSAPTISSPSYTVGSPGLGGSGGTSASGTAASGVTGNSGTVF